MDKYSRWENFDMDEQELIKSALINKIDTIENQPPEVLAELEEVNREYIRLLGTLTASPSYQIRL